MTEFTNEKTSTKNLNRKNGIKGEKAAVKFLKKNRYSVLYTNYTTRFGEVDIIAHHIDTLVFVEVKARHSTEFGEPIEAVNFAKQKKVSQVAAQFLARHQIRNANIRFDVIEVYLASKRKDYKIVHSQNAFDSYLQF